MDDGVVTLGFSFFPFVKFYVVTFWPWHNNIFPVSIVKNVSQEYLKVDIQIVTTWEGKVCKITAMNLIFFIIFFIIKLLPFLWGRDILWRIHNGWGISRWWWQRFCFKRTESLKDSTTSKILRPGNMFGNKYVLKVHIFIYTTIGLLLFNRQHSLKRRAQA